MNSNYKSSGSMIKALLITSSFFIGIIGNIAALWILRVSARTRNRKHVLMLRSLAINDLVAEVGMLVMVYLKKFDVLPAKYLCVGYVFMRAFGIGSGMVALVMALERWLALTRPFLYQQVVTYRLVKRSIICLWVCAAIWTYLPLVGFGAFYSESGGCIRYREGKEITDKIYAYLFLILGTSLCFCIVMCNLSVMWELSRIRSNGRVLVRRISRSLLHNRVDGCTYYQTPEEVAFSKLMAVLCIVFVVCWAPQMISIPLAEVYPKTAFSSMFQGMSDMLMCIYLTLDPYIYVVQRYMENGMMNRSCCGKKRSSNNNSVPTTITITVDTPTSVLLHPPKFVVPANM